MTSGDPIPSGEQWAAGPSAVPVRSPGTRSRSGNAMLRTRGAILDGAQRCVERYGVKRTTMSDIASTAGVAKATLYNHFRTKDDVLAALVEARVRDLASRAAEVAAGTAVAVPGQPEPGRGLTAALRLAADELGTSLGLRRLAADEPAVLIALAAPHDEQAWAVARGCAAEVLVAAGVAPAPTAVELVLRFLVSAMMWPADGPGSSTGAEVLAAALLPGREEPAAPTAPAAGQPGVVPPAAAPPPTVPPVPAQAAAGHALGWPG